MAIGQSDGSIILSTKVDTTGLKKNFKEMTKMAGKAFLSVSALAGAAALAITKMAVSAYADYEQLIGGVETLFGESSKKLISYAHDAFYTAGVSANDYMRQVTSFSANLIRSTGGDTEKAVEVANMALIDMSDNVNKMGSSMESVQLAYQGFAKQQYMLLDNLKLGYGGTKTEMERLLKDAEAITGVKYDISNLADVYLAIHAIQEQLGITGTTAKEAEKTISGSANMTKAAWQDVLIALAGGGDIDKAMNNLVYSITKYLENIVPVIERILMNIGVLIESSAPMLIQVLVKSIIRSIPTLVSAIYQMILGIFNGIVLGVEALFTGGTEEVARQLENSTEEMSLNVEGASDGMEQFNEETEKAVKEANKMVAGFDELNTIQKDSAQNSSGSSGGGASTSVSGVSPVGGGGASGKNIANEISETLLTIMGVVSIALIAIGLILLLFGQFKWGIGFLIAGALTLGITMKAAKKSKVGKDVAKTLSTIMGIVGGALVAIGIMLIMLGSTALGVGFIVAGAVSLIGSVATLAGFDAAEIKSVLSLIMGIAGGAMLALGIMLCVFAGPSPLSIGLIVAGAVSLASSVALNSNKIIESLRGPIGVITAIVSAALIVIGIILICTGVALPLGISLLAAGAIGLVTVVVVNWNTIVQKVKDVFNLVMNWVKTWGLLVLGIVLLFSGVGFALGLALIYQGAKNLTEAKDPKWLGFLEKVKTVWKAVKDYWNTNIAKYFTKEWWGNLAKNAINGFLKWIFNGLNKLIDKLNGFSFGLPDVLGGGRVGFNIKRLDVPQLAKGAVIPANKPFLAMLGDQKSGTNIETPLDTMVEAFNIALSNNNGGFNGRIEVPVIIDGREVLRAVRSNENAVGTQTVFGGFANAY
jgi:hypothetical protein